MHIHDLKPAPGSNRRRKIIGRGIGSGHGKTSGKGHKGNKARGQINPNFEGGQTPLHRRLPQVRGFKPVNKTYYAAVNIGALDVFEDGMDVTAEMLAAQGLLRDANEKYKILGDGALTKRLTVHAHKFSKTAVEKVQGVGGTSETIV